MKAKVLGILVKWGNNEAEAAAMISKSYEYAVKTYPDAKAAKIADIVSALR